MPEAERMELGMPLALNNGGSCASATQMRRHHLCIDFAAAGISLINRRSEVLEWKVAVPIAATDGPRRPWLRRRGRRADAMIFAHAAAG